MAPKKKNTKPASRSTKPSPLPQGLSPKVKQEIMGLVVMALSVLTILAIVSHHPTEQPAHIAALREADKLGNVLGTFGAYLSFFLVTYTFGYAFVAVPILTLAYGWLTLTHRPLGIANRFAFYLLTAMVLIATWLAIPGSLRGQEDWQWSGLIGGMLSFKLYQMFGAVGCAAIWSLLSVVWIILVTRVSISDIIPVMSSGLRKLINGFRGVIPQKSGEVGNLDGDLVPEYLQETPDEDVVEKPQIEKDPVPAVKQVPVTVAPAETQSKEAPKTETVKPVVKTPTDVGLSMDTGLVQDLKSIGHVNKHFSLKKSETGAQTLQPSVETAAATTQKDVEPTAEDLNVTPSDFRALAKSAFDEEVAGIQPTDQVKPKVNEPVFPAVTDEPVPPETANEIVDNSTSADDEPSVEVKPAPKEKEKKSIDFDKANSAARSKYRSPSLDLLEETQEEQKLSDDDILELDAKIEQIVQTLKEFGIETRVASTEYRGPVVAIYQLELPSGLKISKITGLEDEIALALKVKSVRMVPVASKGTIQVEIPKPRSTPVLIRSLFEDKVFRQAKQKYRLGLALGKTIDGVSHIEDLAKMPHLLIAGTTGSGKSVGVNSMITSLLYQFDPSEVKFIMIDPKKVELALYRNLKNHHLICLRNQHGELIEDVITRPENAKLMLNALVQEMELRYEKLAHANVRNIDDYNRRWQEGRMPTDEKFDHHKMEYIIAIIDELADLMMTAPREIETSITRLAQMARAVGIHLVVATQRPSVDVLTGLIKANFPARIAYQVRSKIDSRTILDMSGAEQLLGKGDMLYLPPGHMPIRIQNAFTSTHETEQIVDYIRRMPPFPRRDFAIKEEAREDINGEGDVGSFDALFNEALDIVIKFNQGSASLLQRRLSIGYARAARIVDQLERAGVVGPPEGGKPRQVLITEDQAAMFKI
jgi:S-DNA-T family DNA segregation ATPase FtsK/SpoIIIE